MADWHYTSQETHIDPNTTIFLYTDGLTEAENENHELFGEERMLAVARASLSNKIHSPQKLIETMQTDVHTFVGTADQSDDLTMLAVQYTKQQTDERYQRSISLTNNIENVPRLNTFVDEVCEAMGFDAATTMQLNLALEEAVVNVMKYAYPTKTEGNVSVKAQANDTRLKFIITDTGIPFPHWRAWHSPCATNYGFNQL